MDPVHGLPLWTTPHFAKLQVEKSEDERRKGSSHVSGQFKQLSLYRHLKNSGGFNRIRSHDLCNAGTMLYQLSLAATQLGAGQLVGLICSIEELIFEKRVIDESLRSHQIGGISVFIIYLPRVTRQKAWR